MGERRGTPWTGCYSITLTPRINLESLTQPNMHVSGLWEEAGIHGGNMTEDQLSLPSSHLIQ